jgi:hypothetical protein
VAAGISVEHQIALIDWHVSKRDQLAPQWREVEALYCGDDPERAVDRGGVRQREQNEGDEFRLDLNYLYAIIDTSNGTLLPTNPQVRIEGHREDLFEVAEHRAGLLNGTYKRAKFAQKLRRLLMFTQLHGEGYVKTTWHEEREQPYLQVLSRWVVFVDHSVPWEDAKYVIEIVPYTKEQFQAKVAAGTFKLVEGKEPSFKSAPSAMGIGINDFELHAATTGPIFEWIEVFEFHDLTTGIVSHWLKGDREPLRTGTGRPYKFVDRVYHRLFLNESPKDYSGLADASLVVVHQRKLNEVDMYEMWHTETTIPKTLTNKNAIDEKENGAEALAACSGVGDVVEVSLNEGKTFQDWIGYTQVPTQLPAFDRMRERIEEQIEYTLGFPRQQRGSTVGGDTATESAIGDANAKTRNSVRASAVKELVVSVGKAVLGLYKEFLPPDINVPVQDAGGGTVLANKVTLALTEDKPISDSKMFDEDWFFSWDVVAQNPSDLEKRMLLQQMATYAQILATFRNIDQSKVGAKIARLLDSPEFVIPPGRMPPPTPPAIPGAGGSAPGLPGMGAQPGTVPTDGSLPVGLEQQAVAAAQPGMQMMGSPPKMEG